MKIDLTLEVDVKYDYEPEARGGSHPDGSWERIPHNVSIYSVKCNGIEILPCLSDDDLERLQDTILQNYET